MSEILISHDQSLVYLFYLFDATPPYSPHEFALEYRIHISMFARQLLWLWTCRLRAEVGFTIKDLFPGEC
jgi:hypothetical protein